ncbi:MAG: hypothetical protein R3Y49_04925 [Rikenellaceae bacterium]
MKKLLFLSLLAVGIIASGCKDPETENPESTGTISPFTISVDAVSVDDVTLTVTYDSGMTSYPYLVGAIEKSSVSESGELSDNIATAVMDAVGTSNFVTADGKYVFEGDQVVALSAIWDFEYGTDYYVAVFAVDASGTLLTDVKYQSLTLTENTYGNPTISLVSVDYNSIVVDTKLNGYEGTYYVFAHPKEDFVDTYGSDAYALAVQYMNQEYSDWGTDLSVVDGYYIFNSDATVDVSDAWLLQPSSDYIVGVFGMNATADVLTSVSYIEATTYDPPLDAVELSVVSTSTTSVVVSVTPPVDDEVYLVFPYPKADFETEFNSDPNDLTSGILYLLLYYNINPTVADDYYVFEGANPSIDLSNGWEFEVDTEYVICAVMIDDKMVTSSPVTVIEATTENYSIPTGEIQSVTISNVAYVDATVTVEATYDGPYYIAPYRTEDLKTDFNNDITAMAEWMMAYEIAYGTDFTEANDTWLFEGNTTMQLADGGWAIYTDTEYIVAVFGMLPNGEICTDIHTAYFTTLSSESFTVTSELKSVGDNSVSVDYTPSTDAVSFFAGAFKKSELEGKNENEIYLYVREQIDELTLLYYLHYGNYTMNLNNLSADTEYIAVGFGYLSGVGRSGDQMTLCEFTTTGSSANDLEVPTSVTIPDVEFGSLTLAGVSDGSNATGYTVSLTATPNDKDMTYVTYCRSASFYNYYVNEQYGEDLSDLILLDLNKFYSLSNSYNMTFANYLSSIAMTGDSTFGTYVYYNDTEYVIYVYGLDLTTAQPLTKIAAQYVLINDIQSVMPYAPMANLEPNITFTVNGNEVGSTSTAKEVKSIPSRSFPTPTAQDKKTSSITPVENPISLGDIANAVKTSKTILRK